MTTLDQEKIVITDQDTTPGKPVVHIVNPPMNTHIWKPGMEAKEIVAIARREQREVTALCGYRWVPKLDVEKIDDVCEPCNKMAAILMKGAGE